MQYGNIGMVRDFPNPKIILYLTSVEVRGDENIPLASPEEVTKLVTSRKCTHIMFHLSGLPHRAVEISKAEKHLKKLYQE